MAAVPRSIFAKQIRAVGISRLALSKDHGILALTTTTKLSLVVWRAVEEVRWGENLWMEVASPRQTDDDAVEYKVVAIRDGHHLDKNSGLRMSNPRGCLILATGEEIPFGGTIGQGDNGGGGGETLAA